MDGISFQGAGVSRAAGDARYVRRFVGATLAADTYNVVDSAGATVPALATPNGVIESQLPTDALAGTFRPAGDGARFGPTVTVHGVNRPPVLQFVCGEGTYQAPTAPLSGTPLAQISSRAVTDGAGTTNVVGSFLWRARENLTALAWGTQFEVVVGRFGGAARVTPMTVRGQAGLSEWMFSLATGRMIPTTLGALRNPANTVDLVSWDASGVGFQGTAPIAKPTVTGSRLASPALASLLTQLAAYGLITDSTVI